MNIKTVIFCLGCMNTLLSCQPQSSKEYQFEYQGNPLVRHIYTADPAAHVFNNRLYVYSSHDRQDADYYTMTDWHVFSSDDMKYWTDHGAFF